VKLLIDKSADITTRDNTNSTPILKAKIEGHINIQKLLVSRFCKIFKTQTPSPFIKEVGNIQTRAMQITEESDSNSVSTSSDGTVTKYCKVCWENIADGVLLWCGHVTVCMFCSQYLQLCPICCQPIEKVQKVYIA